MLVNKHCQPTTNKKVPMMPLQAAELLASAPGWSLSDGGKAITRNFNFKTYVEALGFVQKISEIAEKENHHPDVSFGWGYASITFTTHNIGGLHQNDFIMAAKVNELD